MWELFSFGKFRLQTNITKLTKCRRKKKKKKKNTWYMFTKEKTLMYKLLPGLPPSLKETYPLIKLKFYSNINLNYTTTPNNTY